MSESIEDLKKQLQQEKNSTKLLVNKLAVYETNGTAKLFYALNRKANEMADLLNGTKLSDLDLSSKDDKTFERLKIVWNDAANIATAVKTLGEAAGITGEEQVDVNKPIYKRATTPESMADAIGETAGHKKG